MGNAFGLLINLLYIVLIIKGLRVLRAVVLCMFIFCAFRAFGQNSPSPSSRTKAEAFQNSKIWDSAYFHFEASAQECLEKNDLESFLKDKLYAGQMLIEAQKDKQALDHLKTIMEDYPNLIEKYHLKASYYIEVALAYGKMSKMLETYQYSKKALATANASTSTTGQEHFKILEILAPACRRLGLYNEALTYANQLLPYVQDSLSLAHAYNALGLIHSRLLNGQRAKTYFKKSLALGEQYNPEWTPYVINNIGLMFHRLGQLDSAIFWYNTGLEKAKKLFDHKKLVSGALFFNRAFSQEAQGDYKGATYSLQEGIKIARTYRRKETFANYLTGLAWMQIELGQIEAGKKHLLEAQELGVSTMSDDHRVDLFNTYAKLYNALQMPDSALYYYNQSLETSSLGLTSLRMGNEFMARSQETLATTILLKTRTLRTLYHQTRSIEYLKEIMQYHRPLVDNILNLGYEHSSLATSSNFFKNAKELLGITMYAAAELFEKEGGEEYLQAISGLMEFQRLNFIKKHLTYNQLIRFHNISDSLMEKRQWLQVQVHQAIKAGLDQQDHQLELTRELEEVNLAIKEANPNFQQIMAGRTRTLKEIRSRLGAKTGLLQYSYFGDTLFCLGLSAKKGVLLRIPWGEAQVDMVNSLLGSVENKSMDIQEHAHAIAHTLKIGKFLDGEMEDVVIIPDKHLHRVPFEILKLNDSPLISRYTIQYRSSMMELASPALPAKDQYPFLAFAPFNEGKNDNLLAVRGKMGPEDVQLEPLPYSGSEVENITSLWQGSEYLGTEATESNFKQDSKNFNIIHLATHALLDDSNPMYNKIVFSEEDVEDGFLYTYELFGMQLPAELVTLSACNTGIGKFYEGEGMVSLATGFNFAGVENVVMSLWAVPDHTTAEIMTRFYQHLHDGLPIPRALQQAKLDFINTHDSNLASPYYWAGFVVNTNRWPVVNETKDWTTGLVLITLTLVGITFVVAKKKSSRWNAEG